VCFRVCLIFFLSMLSLETRASRSLVLDGPPVRVRLEISQKNIEIDGVGVQIQGETDFYQLVSIPHHQRLRIFRSKANDQNVWVVQREGQKEEKISQTYLSLRAIGLRSQGKALPEHLFLTPRGKTNFDVIGVVNLEDYVLGVVGSEMPTSWPEETLKAQAIAARSYVLAVMRERAREVFHVESSTLDQVFRPMAGNIGPGSPWLRVQKAVQETEGVVLLGSGRHVLKSYYHSDCGGKTSSPQSVWGSSGPRVAVLDSTCPQNPKAHWQLSVASAQLETQLRQYLKNPQLGPLVAMQTLRAGPQDRVEKVDFVWGSGEKTRIWAHQLRSLFGFEKMRSTFFEIQKKGAEYVFSGRGFGHGVGLCQWGARQMGKSGETYRQILRHYYPQSEIQIRSWPKLESQTAKL